LVDAGLILPQTSFTLLLRSLESWEDSVGNYFFGHDIPPTAPPLTTDAAWYRARPDVLGYQAEAWVMSGYQNGTGYDEGVPATSALGTPGYPQSSLVGDVNADGTVNILDLVLVASRFGETETPEADVNGDGIVNIQDLVMVANSLGSVAAAPSAQALHASHVQQWVALAKQAVTDRIMQPSVAAQPYTYERGIQMLEQLLATLVPKSTALLANYPNPFNPETWIPYRLATSSDVQLHIYDTQGRLVRHLDIGHQAAGVYQTRSRAAYWDGRNDMGEAVASGLYFYTLTARNFAATRRMLILK
ncbi:MAG: dockerin type I domain-containing protein, partial [Candidatus Poribacteria bacterium]|nr:dockerin type I domain-containing protein [Candidatus Poribacteria bacterium]